MVSVQSLFEGFGRTGEKEQDSFAEKAREVTRAQKYILAGK